MYYFPLCVACILCEFWCEETSHTKHNALDINVVPTQSYDNANIRDSKV